MKQKIFFLAFFFNTSFWYNFLYSQGTYKNHNGALYESNKELFREDKSPFFVRGIFQLNNLLIQPNLTYSDSLKLSKSANNNCINLINYLYKLVPDSSIFIEITEDSMKFINMCYSPILKSTLWDKNIKSYLEYFDRAKPGHFTISFSLNDIDGFHSSAVFKFPQLTLDLNGSLNQTDDKYLLSAHFIMIKYRDFKDNSLKRIKRRIE